MVYVFNIRIQINDDITFGDIKGFPKIFPLALVLFQLGEYIIGQIHIGPICLCNFNGIVFRPGIHNDNLIKDGVPNHEFGFHDQDFFADGFFLIQSRETQRDGKVLSLLCRHQATEILEFGIMKCIGYEPIIVHRRFHCLWPLKRR